MKKILLALFSVIVLLVLFVVCAYAMKWTKITNITDGIKDQIISLEQQGASADEIEAMCVWYAQTAKRSGGWAYQHPKSCEPLMKSQ